MRRLIPILAFLALCNATFAEALRITTWNLNWFPSGSPDALAPDIEAQAVSEAAAVLRSLDSDVIVLQEVRDWDTSEQLAKALGDDYQAVICSRFADERSTTPGKRQIAILSRLPVDSSWAEEWKSAGMVRPPGGYVFASVRVDAAKVGIFGVHLKNNLTQGNAERDAQLNILKRELSAEQLITQVERLESIAGNEFNAFAIAGNFNTSPGQDAFVSEQTLEALRKRGFVSGFENIPLVARITCPGRNRYPDATFDYVFVKGAILDRPPLITSANLSDHFPVMSELKLEIKAEPLIALVDQAAGALPPRKANPFVWTPVVLLLLAGAIWLWIRQRQAALQPELAVAAPDNGCLDSAWETRASAAEQRAARATAVVRSGLLPHFARLMADRWVRRLLWQRSELVENQHTTAAHVAELEQRLTQLQPKFQARLEAYEKRIAELEHELKESRRDEENDASDGTPSDR